nr:hypothetical protein [Tanacetum cinerariifolium]
MSDARSMSSDSTAPLLPDHPLTHTTPVLVSSLRRTVCMDVHVPPVMSPGLSVSIAEVDTMSDSPFHKRFRSSYDSLPSLTFLVHKRYRDVKILNCYNDEEDDGDEGPTVEDEDPAARDQGLVRAALVMETAIGEPLKLGYEALRRQEMASREGQIPSVFEIDRKDGIVYIDVPAYLPQAPPVQTPPSPEWSSGSLSIFPAPFIVPSPISSPMISLTIPSQIASPATAEDEGFLTELGAQERTAVTFEALWRRMLALEAWARHATLQRELQEMRGRVTALEQERVRKERDSRRDYRDFVNGYGLTMREYSKSLSHPCGGVLPSCDVVTFNSHAHTFLDHNSMHQSCGSCVVGLSAVIMSLIMSLMCEHGVVN